MPLNSDQITLVMEYCKRDLPASFDWYLSEFSFVDDDNLRQQLAKEFYSARYIYKLMEALNVDSFELHAHAKFQVIQYASIYEAVVNYLLRTVLANKEKVKALQYHKAYKPVSALSASTELMYSGEKAFVCLFKDERTPASSIKFSDKLDVLVDLGVLDETYAEDIKEFYTARNSVHIETAARRNTEYHIELAKKAYRRMRPFIDQIKDFLDESTNSRSGADDTDTSRDESGTSHCF